MWGGFTLAIVCLLGADLKEGQRQIKAPSLRRSCVASCIWLALTLAFAWAVDVVMGRTKAIEFLSGYCIEEALSIDNLFVFLLIFNHFDIPDHLQPRVLRWGIFGALAMRGAFIAAGAALLAKFHWIFYGLGAFLLYTAYGLIGQQHAAEPGQDSRAQKLLLRVFPWPLTQQQHNGTFFIVQNNRRYATPLALALCVVELSDVLFALDSVPAIFAITTDAFIVYTSNVFAILGLRALYFVLADMLERFVYLKVGLGLILAFVGCKMLAHGYVELSALASLAIILAILTATMVASFFSPASGAKQRQTAKQTPPSAQAP